MMLIIRIKVTLDKCVTELYTNFFLKSMFKTGKIHISSVDSSLHRANINFLVLVVYHSCIRCRHQEQLGGGYVGHICIIFATS